MDLHSQMRPLSEILGGRHFIDIVHPLFCWVSSFYKGCSPPQNHFSTIKWGPPCSAPNSQGDAPPTSKVRVQMAATFLNFDTRKGRDIHPRYFCGPRHLCQKMFQGCAIYARILKSKVSKPPFPFSSPFALNFPFLLPPFPFSFPSPLSFLLSLSPPFPPPFPLPFTNGTVR